MPSKVQSSTCRTSGATVAQALLLLALLVTTGAVRAAPEDGARLAATCTGCHGTNGHTAGDALPGLAGQSKEALLASLAAFKSGERSATVMTQLAKGYSDEQLEQIAAFFAAQEPSTPLPSTPWPSVPGSAGAGS